MFYQIRKLINNIKFSNSYLDECYVRGIQRSGTNYLETILLKKKINVLNLGFKKRNKIEHKHFRLQDEKDTIFMSKEYYNETFINEISELNSTNEKFKNLLIYKDPINWLDSINKWAIKCNWIDRNKTIFHNKYLMKYVKEWDYYHLKWFDLSLKDKKILMIQWEDILINQSKVIKKLNSFFNKEIFFLAEDLLVKKVNLSDKGKNFKVNLNNKNLSNKQIQKIYTSLKFKKFNRYYDRF